MNYIFWTNTSGAAPVQLFIQGLSEKEQDKVTRQIYLLDELGHFRFSQLGDLEKIDAIGIWEFKIDYSNCHFRIFCGIEEGKYVFLHMIKKTYRKLKRKDIELAVKRLKVFRKGKQS